MNTTTTWVIAGVLVVLVLSALIIGRSFGIRNFKIGKHVSGSADTSDRRKASVGDDEPH
jgi:hypothetical protein